MTSASARQRRSAVAWWVELDGVEAGRPLGINVAAAADRLVVRW